MPVGIWIDRHGARALMSAASLLAGLLVIGWSQARTLQQFTLVWAGLGLCMAALFYEPAFTVIANWFRRERARALALITFVAGFASTIFLPLADLLLQRYGWRAAVLLLGAALIVTTAPLHALVLRRRPADLSLQPDGAQPAERDVEAPPAMSGREALRGRAFWGLTLSFSLVMLAGTAIRVHFVPYLLDQGLGSSLAATGAGLIGAAQVLGRLIFAPLSARISTDRPERDGVRHPGAGAADAAGSARHPGHCAVRAALRRSDWRGHAGAAGTAGAALRPGAVRAHTAV